MLSGPVDLLLDIGHPAHVHLFRSAIAAWQARRRTIHIVARPKDITTRLLDLYGLEHTVLQPVGRGRVGLARELVAREWAMLKLARRLKPRIIAGTSVNATRVARVVGARSVIFNEDDASYVPMFKLLGYGLASAIVTPECLAYEDYGPRHLTYPAYQKLFYLHPARFTPDPAVLDELGLSRHEPYGVVRLSALQAHHDFAARGMSTDMVRRCIDLARGRARVFLTSEKPLDTEFEPYRLPVSAERIHHVLAFAQFHLGDSQSMSIEAALLGVPSLKINSFAGRISVVRDLVRDGLVFDFAPGQEALLLQTLGGLLAMKDRREVFQRRRQAMLDRTIDPLPWLLEVMDRLLEGQPASKVQAWSRSQRGALRQVAS